MTKAYNSKGELISTNLDYYVYLEGECFRYFSNKNKALEYAKFLSSCKENKNVSVTEEGKQIALFNTQRR